MDPTGNFYNYRTALRGAAHRSLTAHSNREKVGVTTSRVPANQWCASTENVTEALLSPFPWAPVQGFTAKCNGNVNLQLKGV